MTDRSFEIRIASLSDSDGISAVLQASYPQLMRPAYDASTLAPALRLMTKANPKLLESGTYYVAESKDEAIVGCGGWTIERPGDDAIEAGVGHIRHFGTHPRWTMHGIGKGIYAACEAKAQSDGITSFECLSSLNAEKFYSALGFESVRQIDVELRDGVFFPGILMRRSI